MGGGVMKRGGRRVHMNGRSFLGFISATATSVLRLSPPNVSSTSQVKKEGSTTG